MRNGAACRGRQWLPGRRICCRCSAASLRALIKDQPTSAGRRGRAECGRSRRSETPPHTVAWYGNADGADVDLERRQYAPCDVRACHKALLSWRSPLDGPMRWGGHTPPVIGLRDGRACAIRFRAVPPATEVWRTPPVIRHCEPRAFADGPNGERENPTTISMERSLGIVPGLDQCATKVEHRGISIHDNALGFAAVRAKERGANRRLRKLLVAISF